jgi:hypothetical protein
MRPHIADPHDVQRCPFFTRGLRPFEAMPACPGYDPQWLPMRTPHADPHSPQATSCWHLAADTVRWFRVPACHHPEAERIVEAAREVACRV